MVLLTTCRADDLLTPIDDGQLTITIVADTIGVAEQRDLSAAVTYDGEPRPDIALEWSTSDSSILVIDPNGRLTATGRGRAEVRVRTAVFGVRANGAVASDSMWVVVPNVTAAIDSATITSVGDTLCVPIIATDALGRPLSGVDPSVTIVADPDTTLSVQAGCLVGQRPGRTATIELTADTTRFQVFITMQQQPASVAAGSGSQHFTGIGDTASVTVAVRDARGVPVATVPVTWTSDDTLVARVDSIGTITALAAGSTLVRALADTLADTIVVTVDPPQLDVSLDSVGGTAQVGSTAPGRYALLLANVGSGAMTWTATTADAWVNLSPASGNEGDSLIVTVDPASLPVGTHTGSITVVAPRAAGSPFTIPVTVDVTGCAVSATPPDTAIVDSLTTADCSDNGPGRPTKIFSPVGSVGDTLWIRVTSAVNLVVTVRDSTGATIATGVPCPAGSLGTVCIADLVPAGSVTVAIASIDSAVTGSFTAEIVKPDPPQSPAGLAQFGPDSVTVLVAGSITPDTSAIVTATATDTDPGDRVRLEVELQPIGTSFADTGTQVSAWVNSGSTPLVVITGLVDDGAYHWQSRVVDESGRASAWTSFGGNAETAPDLQVVIPEPPAAASGLAALRSDSTTVIAVGDTIAEASFVARVVVSDPDAGDSLTVELEVLPVGSAFTGIPTDTAVTAAPSGDTVLIAVPLLDDTAYHWRARVRDLLGLTGPWTSFGGNSEITPDVEVFVPEPPAVATALTQLQSDSTTVITAGAVTSFDTVLLRATIADPDPGDLVSLEVEFLPVGTMFGDTATAVTALGPSGSNVIVAVPPLIEGVDYHWQARVTDSTGRSSAWTSFGGNTELDRDVRYDSPDDPLAPSSLLQTKSDSTTVLAIGVATDEAAVVFRAVVPDPDANDSVQLAIEIQPIGSGFNDVATALSAPVSAGDTASVRIVLSDDLSYHWQARAIDQTGRTSAWGSFGGNAESATDVAVAIPEDPAVPTALGQLRSDSLTAIAVGDTTPEAIVVFQATVTDVDPGDSIRLQVERQPIGVAFTDTPTATATVPVTTGSTGTVTLTGQADDQQYHWQVRSLDQTGRTSAWTSFGGNAETAPDYFIHIPEAPGVPGSIGQFRLDSATAITVGGNSDGVAVVLRGTVSDPDPGDSLIIEVEVQPLGVPFTNAATSASLSPVASGQVAAATAVAIITVQYHWQTRTCDQTARCSAWISFGANAETAPDYIGTLDVPPNAPAGMGQFKQDSLTALSVGDTTDQNSVVVRATVSDPDPLALVWLQVEHQPLGVAFTDTPTATSLVGVTSGLVASVNISVTDDSSYHWQARAIDLAGNPSSWVSFGANAESAADVAVDIPESPDLPNVLAQLMLDSLTTITVGDSTNELSVVFSATVTDPDPGASLRLQVEAQPLGVAFTGTPSGASVTAVAGGATAHALVPLLEDSSYHWQARVEDEDGNTSGWVSFGGNAETAADFSVAIPEIPNVPGAPGQLKLDSLTTLAVGDTTDELSVVFAANVTDPDPLSSLTLQVELRPLGVAFTDTPTGSSVTAVAGGATAHVLLPVLEDSSYHWQSRVEDGDGNLSAWVSFGGNAESAADFSVSLPNVPDLPTGLGQLRIDSVTGIAVGDTNDQLSVVFSATVDDPDPLSTLKLQVEAQPIGVAFTDTPNGASVAGVANGATAFVLLPVLEDSAYHWQARVEDGDGNTGGWVSFGGNAESAADFAVAIPEVPDLPGSLGQLRIDSITGLAVGDTTDQLSVVFSAAVTDPDPLSTLTLQVESQPLGVAFTDTPTGSSVTAVASGATAHVILPVLEDSSYHWQARVEDGDGNTSAWVSFGGNSEAEVDYHVSLPEVPGLPTGLGQLRIDSVTGIAVGDTTDQLSVVFSATVDDPDPLSTLKLQVEAQPIGVAFTDTPNGASVAGVANGATAFVLLPVLEDSAYHWQARVEDGDGNTGGWVSFGGNAESAADFAVAVPEAPDLPAGLGQLRIDSITGLSVGDTTDQLSVVFNATVTDPDPLSTLTLQVESQPLGVAFTDTPTGSSVTAVASGATAHVILPVLEDSSYHWQARVEDGDGNTSAWVSFGGNTETEVDYHVSLPEVPGLPTGLGMFLQDSITVVSVGDTASQNPIIIKATVTDPDPGDLIRLQVEAQPIGTPFGDIPTVTSLIGVPDGLQAAVALSGIDDTSYHWQARTIDVAGDTSAWISFGANPEADADFTYGVDDPPLSPTLALLKLDSLSSLTAGDTTDELSVIIQATLVDPDPLALVRLQVEVQPLGTAFTDTPTDSSLISVITGQLASLRFTGIDDSSYHIQGRTIDLAGNVSPWVSFGANLETDPDLVFKLLDPPSPPGSLVQLESDGVTVIPVGSNSGGLTFFVDGSVFDTDPGDSLHLEVELQPVGIPFLDIRTSFSLPFVTGQTARVSLPVVIGIGYHWQARTCDQTGLCSTWTSYGGNSEAVADIVGSP